MANDPNRDILPVKESPEKYRNSSDRFEVTLVSKYRRHELEDRYIRLYEENNELKKLTFTQEGKIKKLGAKLIRVLGDKRLVNGVHQRRQQEDPGFAEELQMKILELQHENYSLKDKNTVLRQQLATHSRHHMAAHRFPARIHVSTNSPGLMQRHPSAQNVVEGSIVHQSQSSDSPLRDADAHITELNEEIKTLKAQIETLKQELEKSLLTIQKSRVGENIELIKLRRQNKQLEAQLGCAEHSHKLLQDQIGRMQKENEDALQLIVEKQNEMVDLQSKVEEALKLQLVVEEMKNNIQDLLVERDNLKEQCEVTLKIVREKPKELEKINELEKMLSAERLKTTSLRSELETAQVIAATSLASSSVRPVSANRWMKSDSFTQTDSEEKPSEEVPMDVSLKLLKTTEINRTLLTNETHTPYNLFNYINITENKNDSSSSYLENVEKTSEPTAAPVESVTRSMTPILLDNQCDSLLAVSARLKLQNDTECLKDMLKAETQRCNFLENQIKKLQQELKMNQIRYQDVFQQRDLFFKLLDQSQGTKSSKKRKGKSKSASESDNDNSISSTGMYAKPVETYTKNSPIKKSPRENGAKAMVELASPMDLIITKNEDMMKRPVPVPRHRAIIAKNDKKNSNGSISQMASSNAPVTPLPETGHNDEVETTSNSNIPIEVNAVIVENMFKSSDIKIQISILWLLLDSEKHLFQDSSIKALYVDFTLLGVNSAEYETPQALPKPTKGKCYFNYDIDVQWTDKFNDSLRKIKDGDDNGDVILFNIVSEPPGDESQVECTTVGTSAVGFQQFVCATDDEMLLPVLSVDDSGICEGTLAIRLVIPPSVKSFL